MLENKGYCMMESSDSKKDLLIYPAKARCSCSLTYLAKVAIPGKTWLHLLTTRGHTTELWEDLSYAGFEEGIVQVLFVHSFCLALAGEKEWWTATSDQGIHSCHTGYWLKVQVSGLLMPPPGVTPKPWIGDPVGCWERILKRQAFPFH